MTSNKAVIGKAKKANCHIHITGALSVQDMRAIASVSNTNLKPFEPLENKMSFYNYDVWAAAKEITSSKIGLEKSIEIILQREIRDNVSCIELTINPAGMIRRGLDANDFISVLLSSAKFAERANIKFKVKLGVNRKDGKGSISVVEQLFNSCPRDIVVAIDLNGDECKFPTEEFKEGFLRLRERGIPTTIHAGEHFGLSESLFAAIEMKPNRITHSLVATGDDEILKRIKESGIILEISPLSGLFTGALPRLEKYPIKKFIDYDIPMVFGSDDPAIFKRDLTDHLSSLLKCGLNIDKILELNELAFKYLF